MLDKVWEGGRAIKVKTEHRLVGNIVCKRAMLGLM